MGVSEPLIQASLLGDAIENGPVAVFVADEYAKYVAVNQAACVMLGYTREELLGLRVTDVARYGEASGEWDDMSQAGSRAGMSRLTRKDGTIVEFRYIAGGTVVAGMPVYVSIGIAA